MVQGGTEGGMRRLMLVWYYWEPVDIRQVLICHFNKHHFLNCLNNLTIKTNNASYTINVWIGRDFGTSMRRSIRSAFGLPTGNGISGHYKRGSFPFLFSIFSPPFFSTSWPFRTPKNLGKIPFKTPLVILGPPGGHFGFCRRCGVAGGYRAPPSPLGWYLKAFFHIIIIFDFWGEHYF